MAQRATAWKLVAGTVAITVTGVTGLAVVAGASTSPKPAAAAAKLTQADVTSASLTAGRLRVATAASVDRAGRAGRHGDGPGTANGASTTSITSTPTTSTPVTTIPGTGMDTPTPGKAMGRPDFVAGKVASIGATGFTVIVPGSSVAKSVLTSASTDFVETGSGPVSDATAGSEVLAFGMRQADGSLAAMNLTILPAIQLPTLAPAVNSMMSALPSMPSSGPISQFLDGLDKLPVVFGTVTANDGGTLTVTTPAGPQTVTTSGSTVVSATTIVGLSAVTVGADVQAVGLVGTDGTVTAKFVHIGTFGFALPGLGMGTGSSGSHPWRP